LRQPGVLQARCAACGDEISFTTCTLTNIRPDRGAQLRRGLETEKPNSQIARSTGAVSRLRRLPKHIVRLQKGGFFMNFRPLHDRLVVRRLNAEEKTSGGIIIPDTAQEKPQEGEVLAVGPGARDERGQRIPLDVAVGDRILFGKWSGTEVKIGGQDYVIIKQDDVMGVLERDKLKKAA
jgi:chaperonin GroES